MKSRTHAERQEAADAMWSALKRGLRAGSYVTALLPPELVRALLQFQQREKCRRSEAIRRLIERGFAA